MKAEYRAVNVSATFPNPPDCNPEMEAYMYYPRFNIVVSLDHHSDEIAMVVYGTDPEIYIAGSQRSNHFESMRELLDATCRLVNDTM